MSTPEREWLLSHMFRCEGRLLIPDYLGATMIIADLHGEGLIVRGSNQHLDNGISLFELTAEGWAVAEQLVEPA